MCVRVLLVCIVIGEFWVRERLPVKTGPWKSWRRTRRRERGRPLTTRERLTQVPVASRHSWTAGQPVKSRRERAPVSAATCATHKLRHHCWNKPPANNNLFLNDFRSLLTLLYDTKLSLLNLIKQNSNIARYCSINNTFYVKKLQKIFKFF